MFKLKIALKMLVLALVIVGFQTVADAQATRTWVSGVGDDVNPCSRTAPCKTFAGAISKTATNGEINCMDAGGFGAVTVTKSITIDCSNEVGSILNSSVNGITINITSATDTKKAVRLRGLSIDGAGTGLSGIRVLAANSLSVENVVVDGNVNHAVSLEMSASNLKMNIDNVSFRGNALHGINTFLTGSATANISVSDSEFASNGGNAFNLGTAVKMSVRDTNISNNAIGAFINGADLTFTRCSFIGNTTAVQASGGTIRLNGNTITGNGTGILASGGSILSYSNNAITANTTNGTPTGTLLPL
ncbi:MAG: right-handed parallel beta-helix repeat-containing protein [Pyrinomonadaceae bacterium]|jgi:hypothetical protein|nr:right-handed parallel beta-helix repeat-containing protein [Pyrinomonadaceae bacterium]